MITQQGDMWETQNFGKLVLEQAKSDELLSEDILILYSKINEFQKLKIKLCDEWMKSNSIKNHGFDQFVRHVTEATSQNWLPVLL